MPSLHYLKLGRTALGRTALGRMALGRNFPGRGRFWTLLSHPALLLATGNRGLSQRRRGSVGTGGARPKPGPGARGSTGARRGPPAGASESCSRGRRGACVEAGGPSAARSFATSQPPRPRARHGVEPRCPDRQGTTLSAAGKVGLEFITLGATRAPPTKGPSGSRGVLTGYWKQSRPPMQKDPGEVLDAVKRRVLRVDPERLARGRWLEAVAAEQLNDDRLEHDLRGAPTKALAGGATELAGLQRVGQVLVSHQANVPKPPERHVMRTRPHRHTHAN